MAGRQGAWSYCTKVSKVGSIQKQNEGEVIDIKYYKKSE